jgi:hypothetical protein
MAWHGRKSTVDHLRTFGCVVYTKDTHPQLKKLEDRSTPMVFLGYNERTKGYRVFDPARCHVISTRDTIFYEVASCDWKAGAPTVPSSEFVVEHIFKLAPSATAGGDEPPVLKSPAPAAGGAESPAPAPASTPPAAPQVATPSPTPVAPSPVHVTPLSKDKKHLDTFYNDEPLQYHTINNILSNTLVPGVAQRELSPGSLLFVSDGEPGSDPEAEHDEAWRAAMKEEMDCVERNGTWELTNLPCGHHPIGLCWVYKLKKNEAGVVIKHKARLIARGYVQQHGIDFDEVFAPIVRMESVRLRLALAAHQGWLVHHMDVKSTFLNGVLEEEIYVMQPPGFTITGQQGKVLRLKKALYGLRQAPRTWNTCLDATLKGLGFEQSAHEHAVYGRGHGSARLLVDVYVDDLVITGSNTGEIDRFKHEMKQQFLMSDLGLLSFYLGIKVRQHDGGIKLCQSTYAKKILMMAGMLNCNPAAIPMETRLKLSRNSTADEVDSTAYRRLIGSLRYLVDT